MSEQKTVAFFGDSYVAKYHESWLQHFCIKNNLKYVHLGKLGADPYYVLESWEKINDSGQQIDFCIYAHTEVGRIYHPSYDVPLTWGCVNSALNNEITMDIDRKTLQAVFDFMSNFSYPQEYNLKSKIIPRGIDRFLAEKNKAFGKIIHIWSFAPIRANLEAHNTPADSEWGFEMNSGTNIMMDLSNLTRIEPGYPNEKFDKPGYAGIDLRKGHFSPLAFDFLTDVLTFAIGLQNGTQVRLPEYINRHSTWNDYLNAWEQVKREYNENTNSWQR